MHYSATSRENRCSPTAEMRRDQQRFGTFGEYTGSRNSRNQSLKSDDHRYYFHPTFRQRPTDTGTFIPRPRSVDMNLLYEEVLAVQEIDHVPSLMERYEEKSIEYDQGPLRIREETVFEETDPVISEDIVNEVHLVSGVWKYVRTLRRSRSERRMFKKLRKRSVFSRKPDEEDQKPQRWETVVRDRAQRSSSMGGTVPSQDPVSLAGTALRDGGAARHFDDSQQASDRRQDILGPRVRKRHYDEPPRELNDAAAVTDSGHLFGQTVLQMSTRPRVPSDLSVGQAPSYPRFVTEITLPPQTDMIGRGHIRSPIHSESLGSDIAGSSYVSSAKMPLTNDTPPPSMERKEEEPTTIGSILSWHHDSKPVDQKRTGGDSIRSASPDARNLSGIVSWHIDRDDETAKKSHSGASVEQIVRWHTTDAGDGKNRIESRRTGYERFDEKRKLPEYASTSTKIRPASDVDDGAPPRYEHPASLPTSDAGKPLTEPSKITVGGGENHDQLDDRIPVRQQVSVHHVLPGGEAAVPLTTRPGAVLAEHYERPATLHVRPPFARKSSAANEESPSSYFFRHKLAREKAAEETKGRVDAKQQPLARLPHESSGAASDTSTARHPPRADTSVPLAPITSGLSEEAGPIKKLAADSSREQSIANGSGDTSSTEVSQEIFYEAEELPFDKPKGQREIFTAAAEQLKSAKLEKDHGLPLPEGKPDKQVSVDISRTVDLKGASRPMALEEAQPKMGRPKGHGTETRRDPCEHAVTDEAAGDLIKPEKQPLMEIVDHAPKEPATIEGVKKIMGAFKDYPSKLFRHLQTKKPIGTDKDHQADTQGRLEGEVMAASEEAKMVEAGSEPRTSPPEGKFPEPADADDSRESPTAYGHLPARLGKRKHGEQAADEHEIKETGKASDALLHQGKKSYGDEPTTRGESGEPRTGSRKDAFEDAVKAGRVGPAVAKYQLKEPPLADEIVVPDEGRKDVHKPKEGHRTAILIDEFSKVEAGKAVMILAEASQSRPATVPSPKLEELQRGDRATGPLEGVEDYAGGTRDKSKRKEPTATEKATGGRNAHRLVGPEEVRKPTDGAGTDRRDHLPKRQIPAEQTSKPAAPVPEHRAKGPEDERSSDDKAEAADREKDHRTRMMSEGKGPAQTSEQGEGYQAGTPGSQTARESAPQTSDQRPIPDGIKPSDRDVTVKLGDIPPAATINRAEPYEEAFSQVPGACEAIVSKIKEGITLAKEKLEAVPELLESTVESLIASGIGEGDKDWTLDPALPVDSLPKDSTSPADDHDFVTPGRCAEPSAAAVQPKGIEQPQAGAARSAADKSEGGEGLADDVQWTDGEIPPDVLLVSGEVGTPIVASPDLRIKEVEPPSSVPLEVPSDGEFSCLITPAVAITTGPPDAELKAGEGQTDGSLQSETIAPDATSDFAPGRFLPRETESETHPALGGKTAAERIEEVLEDDIGPRHRKIIETSPAKTTEDAHAGRTDDRGTYLQADESNKVATPLRTVAEDEIKAGDLVDEASSAERNQSSAEAPEIRRTAATGVYTVPAESTPPEVAVPSRVDVDVRRVSAHPKTAPWADTVVLEILKFHAAFSQILSKEEEAAAPTSTQQRSHGERTVPERSPSPLLKTTDEHHAEGEVREEPRGITAEKETPTPGELLAIPSAVGNQQAEAEASRAKRKREASRKEKLVEPHRGYMQRGKMDERTEKPPKEHSQTPVATSDREGSGPARDHPKAKKSASVEGPEIPKSRPKKGEKRERPVDKEGKMGKVLSSEKITTTKPPGGSVGEERDVEQTAITGQPDRLEEPKHKKGSKREESTEFKARNEMEAIAKQPEDVIGQSVATGKLEDKQADTAEQFAVLRKSTPDEDVKGERPVGLKQRKEESDVAKTAVPAGRGDFVNERPGVGQGAIAEQLKAPKEPKHKKRDRRGKSAEIEEEKRETADEQPMPVSCYHHLTTDTSQDIQMVQAKRPETPKASTLEEDVKGKRLIGLEEKEKAEVPNGHDDFACEKPGVEQVAITEQPTASQDTKHGKRDRRGKSAELKEKKEKEAAGKEPLDAGGHDRAAIDKPQDTHLIRFEQLEGPERSIPEEEVKAERPADLKQKRKEAEVAVATDRGDSMSGKAGVEQAPAAGHPETLRKSKPKEGEKGERPVETKRRKGKTAESEKPMAANDQDSVGHKPDVEHVPTAESLEIPETSKHKKEAKRGASAEVKEKRKAAAAKEFLAATVPDRPIDDTPGERQPSKIEPPKAAEEPRVEDDAKAKPVEAEGKEKAVARPKPAVAGDQQGLPREKPGAGQDTVTEQLEVPKGPKHKKGKKREMSAETERHKAATGGQSTSADDLFTAEKSDVKLAVVTEKPEASLERRAGEEGVRKKDSVHPKGDKGKKPAGHKPMELSECRRSTSDELEVEYVTAEQPEAFEGSEPMEGIKKKESVGIKRVKGKEIVGKTASVGSGDSIGEKHGFRDAAATGQLEVPEGPKHKKSLKIPKPATMEERKEGAVAERGPTTASGTIHSTDRGAAVEPAITTDHAGVLEGSMPEGDVMSKESVEVEGKKRKPTTSPADGKDRHKKAEGRDNLSRVPGLEEARIPVSTADRASGASSERIGEQQLDSTAKEPTSLVGLDFETATHQALAAVLAVLDWHKALHGRAANFQVTAPVDSKPLGGLARSCSPGGQVATEKDVPEVTPKTELLEESRPSNLASILENHKKLAIIVTPPSETPSDEAPDSGDSVGNLVRVINDIVNVNKTENKVRAETNGVSRDRIGRARESGDLAEIIPAEELDLDNFEEKPPAEGNGYFELLERRCHESERFAPAHMRSPKAKEDKLFDWSPLADLSSCGTERAPLPEVGADLLESEPSRADLIKLPAPPAAMSEHLKCEGLFGPIYGEDSFGYKKVFGPDDSSADQNRTLWDEPSKGTEPGQQILLEDITRSLEGVLPAYDHAIRTMDDLTKTMIKGDTTEKRPAKRHAKEAKTHDTAADEAAEVEATRSFKEWLASALYYSAALCWWSTEGKTLLMDYYRKLSTDSAREKPTEPQSRGARDDDHREVPKLQHWAAPPEEEKHETQAPSDVPRQHAPKPLSGSPARSDKDKGVSHEISEPAGGKAKHPSKKASGKRSAESHSTEPPSKIPVPVAKVRKDSSSGSARGRTTKTFAEEELSSSPQRHKHSSPLLRREHQLKQSYQKDLQMLRDLNSELAILLQGDESGRGTSPSFRAGTSELSSSETTPEVKSEKRERNISSSDRSSPFEATSDADSRCRQRSKRPKWKKPDIKSDATLSESFSKISASRTDDRRSPSSEAPTRKTPDTSHAETKLVPPRPARNISTETAAKKLAQLLPPFCYTLPGKLGFSVTPGGESAHSPKHPTEHEEVDSPFDTLVPRFIRKEPDSAQSSTSGRSNDESKPRLRQRRTDKSPSGR